MSHPFPDPPAAYQSPRIGPDRPVTAVLGPTNTGKTHYAIERMLAYKSGMIGLPLRLLAREIYDKLIERRPVAEIALVTGEEKIIPRNPRYWICTVEAMPLSEPVDFMAIDEVQLANSPERGRTFTSRILYARGQAETLLLGSDSMAPILRRLFPNLTILGRERFSTLTFTGSKKVTRLPRRSAIVAFSADTVYAIAELVRRQRGGAAVVLGALSPRTRNAQADLYQNGEVDYLIATDAIGMGLNMDIDHVAFAARRKFDGRHMRELTASEAAQIAGRAGRGMRDGTFGITADCRPFDDEMIEAIEEHRFDPVTGLFWRAEALDFGSVPALIHSLNRTPPREELIRARPDDDERAFTHLIAQSEVAHFAKGGAALALLWEVCQIPDFRKVTLDQHTKMIGEIYLELMRHERVSEQWLAPRVTPLDRMDGDIDTLSSRIAHIRSWTYLANRSSWIVNASYWQEATRAIEDRLSDALHERLTQRFVDRRTAILLKKLKDDAPLLAGVTEDGEVIVEGQFVGRLLGFEFIIDPRASGPQTKPLQAAAEKALRPVLAARASALANAEPNELAIGPDGVITWRSSIVGALEKGPAPLRPKLVMRAIDAVPAVLRGRVEDRLTDYLVARMEGLLSPLINLQRACDITGEESMPPGTRAIAWRVVENFGATSRHQIGDDLKALEQKERARLRNLGVRFGEYTLFMPALLKPAPSAMLTLLWTLWNDKDPASMIPPKAGLVSTLIDETIPHAFYYASGYRPSGKRAVRIDMLERLAGEIRNARDKGDRREGFEATSQMMSLVGCSGEEFEAILTSLSFRKNIVKRQVPIQPEPIKIDVRAETAGEPTTIAERADPAADRAADPAPASPDSLAPEQSAEPVADASTESLPTNAAPAVMHEPVIVTDHAIASAPENPTEEKGPTEDIEIVLWRFQSKRPANRTPNRAARQDGAKAGEAQTNEAKPNHAKPDHAKSNDYKRRKPQNAGQGHSDKGKFDRDQRGKNGDFRKNNNRKDEPRPPQNPHMHKPRHLKIADPDSPFAVLAALKGAPDKTE